jgi:hypothetical protein
MPDARHYWWASGIYITTMPLIEAKCAILAEELPGWHLATNPVLAALSGIIAQLQQSPGRLVQNLAQSSLTVWEIILRSWRRSYSKGV